MVERCRHQPRPQLAFAVSSRPRTERESAGYHLQKYGGLRPFSRKPVHRFRRAHEPAAANNVVRTTALSHILHSLARPPTNSGEANPAGLDTRSSGRFIKSSASFY